MIKIFEFLEDNFESLPDYGWFFWAKTIVGMIFVLFAVVFFVKALLPEKKLSFEETVALQMAMLQEQLEANFLQAVYFGLVSVFKAILKERYHINVLALTDDEVLAELSASKRFSDDNLQQITLFLERAFVARFGRETIAKEIVDKDFLFLKKLLFEANIVFIKNSNL